MLLDDALQPHTCIFWHVKLSLCDSSLFLSGEERRKRREEGEGKEREAKKEKREEEAIDKHARSLQQVRLEWNNIRGKGLFEHG